jgi:hypothetical protein
MMMQFLHLERFDNHTYVGEISLFDEKRKVSIGLPMTPNGLEEKVELFVRDGKLYTRLMDSPNVEVRVLEEFLKCKDKEDTTVCSVEPIIYDILAIAKANKEKGILVDKVIYDNEYGVYKITTISGDEYYLRPQELVCCDRWKIRYVNIFREDKELKGMLAIEDMEKPSWIRMYKITIPKSLIEIQPMDNSGIRFYGQILVPRLF